VRRKELAANWGGRDADLDMGRTAPRESGEARPDAAIDGEANSFRGAGRRGVKRGEVPWNAAGVLAKYALLARSASEGAVTT
jgi:hypothetical protein